MPVALESPETQGRGLRGAELTALPDGSRIVQLATREGPVQGRALLCPGSPSGVLLVGPTAFAGTLGDLAVALAAQGVQTLCVHPRPGVGACQTLEACVAFLRDRGASRIAVAAAAESADAALRCANGVDADALLLLAPAAPAAALATDALRGRPVTVCVPGERDAGLPFAHLAHAAVLPFSKAGPCLDEVRADLSAVCVPVLLQSLREAPGLHDA